MLFQIFFSKSVLEQIGSIKSTKKNNNNQKIDEIEKYLPELSLMCVLSLSWANKLLPIKIKRNIILNKVFAFIFQW